MSVLLYLSTISMKYEPHYLSQINSDLYETYNLSFRGPNWFNQPLLTIPSFLLVHSGSL